MNLAGYTLFGSICLSFGVTAASSNPEATCKSIQPNSNLSWVPCYTSGLECARFSVSLDHTNSTSATVTIALVRVPSDLSADDKNYRGPVLFNPGGPGGSGVDFVVQSGLVLQQIIGTQFDIIGSDPRGFGRTTPPLRGFTNTEELITFSLKTQQDPPLGSTPDSVARTYARGASYGAVAASRLKDIGPYVGTPLVARDMLAITKAAGFEKLQYWGVSYGTVLGQTFASMFPENIERLVLDGVEDAFDYYSGEFRTGLGDTDKVMDYFYEKCVLAGPLQCAIYEKTPYAVKARVENIWHDLKRRPIPTVIGPGPQDYGLVDYGMARNTIFELLYQPFAIGGQNMSLLFASLEKGDDSPFFTSRIYSPDFLQCSCDEGVPQDNGGFGRLSWLAIQCSDAAPINDTVAELEAWYEEYRKVSTFADVWPLQVACAGWKIRSVEKYDGTRIGAETSFPLLFIGNTADPVTPLVSAKRMSRRFPGSAVLTVDTPGHTTFAATSECTALAVRAYFQNGTLPRLGTVCGIESMLFGDSLPTMVTRRDEGLASALAKLRENMKVPRRH